MAAAVYRVFVAAKQKNIKRSSHPPTKVRALGVGTLAGPNSLAPRPNYRPRGTLYISGREGGRAILKNKALLPGVGPTNRNISPTTGSRPGAWTPNERISIRIV